MLDETNRLELGTYDAGGNLTVWNGNFYGYDPFNMMKSVQTGSDEWAYAYSADDERVAGWQQGGYKSFRTFRGLDNRVLRRVFYEAGITNTTTTQTDYVHRAGGIVGSWTFYDDGSALAGNGEAPQNQTIGERHFALDHLGTTRLITSGTGAVLATHTYYPFGREASVTGEAEEPMRFTGHERDLFESIGAPEDDLDYMHARFSSPITGRFLSTDPSPNSIRLNLPHSWNRYTYTLGNPLRFVDPTGAVVRAANAASQRAYDSYVSSLDPESEDYQNLAQLENSEIVYVVNVEDLGGGNEGSVTFDGESVFLNVDPAGARDTMSFDSRLAHEVQHGVQVDNGMIGFRRQSGGDWTVTFTDIFDEVDAWNAQLRQAAPTDLFRGNLRGYQQAQDRAGFLMNHGYDQYRGRTGATQRVNAPTVPGYTPGSILRTDNWYYRIP